MSLKTWTGGGGDNNWSTGANWGGSAPIAGDDLAFGGTTRLTPNNDIAADTSFNSITFNSGAGAFTLSGNRITLAGNINQNATNLQTISLAIIINSQIGCYVTNGDLTISGIISGSGGVDGHNTYTLTLTADNTFTSYVWMYAGTLSVPKISNKGTAQPLGAASSDYDSSIFLGAGSTTGTLKYTGSGHTHDRNIDMYGLTGGATVEHAGTGLLKFTGIVSNVDSAGAKKLVLTGSTAGTGEISGVIGETETGPITVEKQGTSTWTLSGANTYDGGTTIKGGLLVAAHATALSTGTVTFDGGRRLTVNDGLTITNNIVIGANTGQAARGILENSSTGNATISGTITINNTAAAGGHFAGYSTGTLILSGTITSASVAVSFRLGIVIVSGGGSYATVTHNAGTIRLGANNGLATGATVDMSVSAASNLDLAGYTQSLVGITKGANVATVGNSSTTADSTLTLTGSPTWDGVIADVLGSGTRKVALVINSSGGNVVFTGANTYTGTTTVSVGTLSVRGSLAAGSAVSVSSGATLSGSGTVSGTVAVAGGGIVAPAGVASEVTLDTGALTLNSTSILNFGLGTTSDKVAVTGALTLDGTINVTAVAGFTSGAYLILTYTGALTNNGLNVGTLPAGYAASVITGGGNVYLSVSVQKMTRKQQYGLAIGQRTGME